MIYLIYVIYLSDDLSDLSDPRITLGLLEVGDAPFVNSMIVLLLPYVRLFVNSMIILLLPYVRLLYCTLDKITLKHYNQVKRVVSLPHGVAASLPRIRRLRIPHSISFGVIKYTIIKQKVTSWCGRSGWFPRIRRLRIPHSNSFWVVKYTIIK